MKMEFSFQGREMLLFLTINMAAVTWKRLWKKDFASFKTFSLLHQVTQLLEGREKNNNNSNSNSNNNNNNNNNNNK